MQTLKIQKRLLGAALAAGLAIGLTSTASAQVIGNFETAALDGWGSDGGPGSPAYAQTSAYGVTLGSSALASTIAQGGYWGPSTGNLYAEGYGNALFASTTLQYDITFDNRSLAGDPGGSVYYDQWAQDNDMSISLYGGSGLLNLFLQANNMSGGPLYTDSSGHGGQWAGVDGTRTMTWNLNGFTTTDPNGIFGGTLTAMQIAQDYASIGKLSDVKFNFVEQMGVSATQVGPGTFYFDNVQLNGVPEPATIAMLLAGGAMLVGVTVRRSRSSRS
jgi:hypothetical protein